MTTDNARETTPPAVNYNGRIFRGVENYDSGDLNPDTRFHYHQRGKNVWATIAGGLVRIGTLIADLRDDGSLVMVWQYLNTKNEFISGTCFSRLEVLPDGRYRLHESWNIHGPDGITGESVIEEVVSKYNQRPPPKLLLLLLAQLR